MSTRRLYAGFYWTGMILAVGCLALTFAGHTDFVSNLNQGRFPLSWMAGLFAILAFVVTECFHRDDRVRDEASDPVESFEFQGGSLTESAEVYQFRRSLE